MPTDHCCGLETTGVVYGYIETIFRALKTAGWFSGDQGQFFWVRKDGGWKRVVNGGDVLWVSRDIS